MRSSAAKEWSAGTRGDSFAALGEISGLRNPHHRQEAPSSTWAASLYRLDVDPDGEPVTVSTYVAEPLGQAPTAALTTTVRGGEVVFDDSGSKDADGTVTTYEWYVSTPTRDDIVEGPTLRLP